MNRCTSGVILLSIVFLYFGCNPGSDKQPTKPSARSGEPKIKSGEMITSSPGGDKQPTKPSARSTKGENEKSKVGSPGGVASSLAEYTNSIGMKFKLIPAGEFMMGSKLSSEETDKKYPGGNLSYYEDEHPRHKVRITRPFYLGIHEVTVGDFKKFVAATGYKTEAEKDGEGGYGWNASTEKFEGRDPKYTWKNTGFTQANSHPVVNVTWNDAQAFVKWLSQKDHRKYGLPTEAQWEYACRAGTETPFHFGSDPDGLTAVGNVADGTAKAACTKNYSNLVYVDSHDGYVFTSPVGKYHPNAFGLCDMHGNVWEWCADWYDKDYYEDSPVDDPTGPTKGSGRVYRGGGWSSSAGGCRSADRSGNTPGRRYSLLGFRVALVPSE